MASIEQTVEAIDKVAASKGFSCKPVSWEDAQRGTVGGTLSCWGGNISDVRLWEKTGKLLYTLRSDNWNERLGYVSAKEVSVVVGNGVRSGSEPRPTTLKAFLTHLKEHGQYAGITSHDLFANAVDELLTIRFQTVFLPIQEREAVEFCTEVYNYNTTEDSDPRNLLLLCTPQGTSIQQDGCGAKRVFFHAVDPQGVTHRYWLEGERSSHGVGGAQVEGEKEAAEAASRGKATAIPIGTRAMGTRFNVQMLIQLPLTQKEKPRSRGLSGCGVFGGGAPPGCCAMACSISDSAPGFVCYSAAPRCCPAPPNVGVSNAARVSRGSQFDTYNGVAKPEVQRDTSQHGTITVTMYYTVAGGVPSATDVEAAIADLDSLYKACPSDKRLAECGEVTSELTVKTMQDIKEKVTTQGYVPPIFGPNQVTTFPEDE